MTLGYELGYDKALHLLPFDHRHSHVKSLFDFEPPLPAERTRRVCDSKQTGSAAP